MILCESSRLYWRNKSIINIHAVYSEREISDYYLVIQSEVTGITFSDLRSCVFFL